MPPSTTTQKIRCSLLRQAHPSLSRSPYEREAGFTSPVLSAQDVQETAHLHSAVEKLADMDLDVLLVEKSVARDAQVALLDRNISLALNVKRSVLGRLARCTGAQASLRLSPEI